jgi:hypothetical protein
LLYNIRGHVDPILPNSTPPVDNFAHFIYYLPFVHVTKYGLSTDQLPTYLPTSSCPQSTWMTPNITGLRSSEIKVHIWLYTIYVFINIFAKVLLDLSEQFCIHFWISVMRVCFDGKDWLERSFHHSYLCYTVYILD